LSWGKSFDSTGRPLNYNDVELRHKIKIRGANETPSLKEERVPTKEELRRIFLSAGRKYFWFSTSIFFSTRTFLVE
jgi:hypothetical protein